MNKELKELVKKHFNLVDASESLVEETLSEETNVEVALEEDDKMEESIEEVKMAEIKTADGEITLKHAGEELSEGIEIFVITEDGDIPAPDGEHALEGGVSIITEGGVITSVFETPSEEVEAEEEIEIEMSEESDISIHEELIKALSAEFKTQIDALKLEFNKQLEEVKGKVETFSAEPATEKTITTNKFSKKTDLSYEPTDAKKKAQFERLVNLRKK
jgi:hypothetical protein